MKFKTLHTVDMLSTAFSAIVSDEEIANSVFSERRFNIFTNMVLNRLANMVAAYYFKKHRERFDDFLASEECAIAITKHLAERISLSVETASKG